jgi:hypothetical protein
MVVGGSNNEKNIMHNVDSLNVMAFGCNQKPVDIKKR